LALGIISPAKPGSSDEPSATSVEKTPGAIKKYLQVRTAMKAKQMANDHRTTGISDRRSRDIEPSYHAKMAANTRDTETKSPNPLKKSQYERLNP